MKYILLLCFFLQNNFLRVKHENGDPFDYIESKIKLIKHWHEFFKIITESYGKIIVLFSYINNHYGGEADDFTYMAKVYNGLKNQFGANHNILFYRMNMGKGIRAIMAFESPSMHIFYNGKKISVTGGKKTAQQLSSVITDTIKKVSNKIN